MRMPLHTLNTIVLGEYKPCWNVFLVFILAAGILSCKGAANRASVKAIESMGSTAEKGPAILEIVHPIDKKVDPSELVNLISKGRAERVSTYQWKNHLVVYSSLTNMESLRVKAKAQWPDYAIKLYKDPFYAFQKEQCGEGTIAKEWEHTLLTANLVEDTLMQKEYLMHHAQQQTKWPEVAKGFCQANFQQLLLFKEGRQLMLIISTPKDSSLAVLNPRTTKNNPRMNEWNTLMQKYQEGIAGTQPGEVWVFLEPVNRDRDKQ